MKETPDDAILDYLKDHTYEETMNQFGISRMTISRIKKRTNRKYTPEKINLAIIGLGNAASALIQGIEYYRNNDKAVGLLRPTFAGYHISDRRMYFRRGIGPARRTFPGIQESSIGEYSE